LGIPNGDKRGDLRFVNVHYRKGDKLLENWGLMDIPYWLNNKE
jgi:hypothetical protein